MRVSVQLVDDISENVLGLGKLHDVEGDPVVAGRVAVKQVGLHPIRVAGVLHEEVVEVRVLANFVVH